MVKRGKKYEGVEKMEISLQYYDINPYVTKGNCFKTAFLTGATLIILENPY